MRVPLSKPLILFAGAVVRLTRASAEALFPAPPLMVAKQVRPPLAIAGSPAQEESPG